MAGASGRRANRVAWNVTWREFAIRKTRSFSAPIDSVPTEEPSLMGAHRSEGLGLQQEAPSAAAGTRITVAPRLDRLPKSRYIRKLILLLSLGACFEFYDLFFSAYIAPAFYTSGIFTPTN